LWALSLEVLGDAADAHTNSVPMGKIWIASQRGFIRCMQWEGLIGEGVNGLKGNDHTFEAAPPRQ
jgi:hypothetical protein